MAQASLSLSGGFWPTSLTLFQASPGCSVFMAHSHKKDGSFILKHAPVKVHNRADSCHWSIPTGVARRRVHADTRWMGTGGVPADAVAGGFR